MKKSIQYGSKTIEYDLQFSERKTLGITVTPELDVLVKAPQDAELEKIESVLHKKIPWILKQQSLFLSYFPKQTPKKYVSGETHLYLGRQYRLKIVLGESESVKLKGKYIIVECIDKGMVRQLLEEWYKRHAVINPNYALEKQAWNLKDLERSHKPVNHCLRITGKDNCNIILFPLFTRYARIKML